MLASIQVFVKAVATEVGVAHAPKVQTHVTHTLFTVDHTRIIHYMGWEVIKHIYKYQTVSTANLCEF